MENQPQPTATPSPVPAILGTLVLGMLWFALLAMLFAVLPAFIKTFDDFDAELPTITRLAVRAADFFAAYWYAVLPLVVGGCAANLLVFHALGSRPHVAVLRWIWLGAMLLIPLGLMVWVSLAVYLPWRSISQQLS